MSDRFPLPLGRAAGGASTKSAPSSDLADSRSGGSARSASRSTKSDGRPATIALGRHRSSPTARRRGGGGSVKSATSDLTEPALESPRSAAADVSVSDKARVFANATDADDDGTHATDETQATDGSRSQMTEGAGVPDSMENDGQPQIVAADGEATSESGGKKSKKKFWLKPKMGPKPLAVEDADRLEKGAEEVEAVASIASGDGATCASKKLASENESRKVAASIENKEESPTADSKASESEASAATSSSVKMKKKRSWLKPSLGLKKNVAEDATRSEKESDSESRAEDESASKLSASEDAERRIKTAGLPREVASISGEGESKQEKKKEEKPTRLLGNEAAKEDVESFETEAAKIKTGDLLPGKDSDASDHNKPLEEKTAGENSVEDSAGADAASECSGKKKKNLGLNLSSFSKAMSKSNISVPKLGAKLQAGKGEADGPKSKEGTAAAVVAEEEGEGYASRTALADGAAPTVKAGNANSNSMADTNSEEALLKICMSDSALSIRTNDTTYTEYVNADSRNTQFANNIKEMTNSTEEVVMAEVDIKQVSTRLSDERAGDQGVEWSLENFEEEAAVDEASLEELRLRIEEDEVRKREEELLERERRRREDSVASASLSAPQDDVQTGAGCGLLTIFGFPEGDKVRGKEAGRSIEDSVSAQFVLNHVSDDKSDSSLVWSRSLLDEMRQVKESLDVIDVAESTSKNLFSGLEALPPDAPEDAREEYYRALSRAAVLNARMESRRAELELRKIELENARVEARIGRMMEGDDGSDDDGSDDDITAADLDTLDDTAASEGSAESFFSALHRLFMPQEDGRIASTESAVTSEPEIPPSILKY